MNETYEEVAPGWIWQQPNSSPLIKYDHDYIEPYSHYDDKLSLLRYDFCRKYAQFSSVLDVGYGDGRFLKVCKNNGLTCYGNDVSGYPVPEGVEFSESRNRKVDLVTFFDCIEHFPQRNIEMVLQELQCNFICITVPWCHFIDFENWKHRKPNEHFHYFDVRGLSRLLNCGGFELIIVSSYEDEVRKGNGRLPNILSIIGKKHG